MKWLDQRRRRKELLRHEISAYVTGRNIHETSLWLLVGQSLSINPRIDLLAEYDGHLLCIRGTEAICPVAPPVPVGCTFFAEITIPGLGNGGPRFTKMKMR